MFYIKKKISTKNIYRLIEPYATEEPVLIIHSEDVALDHLFPNAFSVTKRKDVVADVHVDDYYHDLHNFPSEQHDLIICTGLLEHVPEPQRLVDDIWHLLRPGGKLVLQASSSFSVHEAPNNFFQFLPYGMHHLFRNWKDVSTFASCGPYETISILLQRIAYQTSSNALIKGISILAANFFLLLDRFVGDQYGSMHRNETTKIDSMLASNIQVVAQK